MAKTALFQGRFQPVSIGHAATLGVILRRWESVVIGVVYDTPRPERVDPRFDGYLARVDQSSYGPGRNPFRPEEIQRMWEGYIDREGLTSRVRMMLVKRLEYELDLDSLFPPDQVDLVWPMLSPDDHGTDVERHELYPAVLRRPIRYVRPAMKLHNSRIRSLIQTGNASWSTFIPPGAYEIFASIDGPRRVAEAMRERTIA